MSDKCSISDILRQATQHKKALIKGNIVAIVATLFTVTIPLFIPILVDELLLKQGDGMTAWVASHIFTMTLSGYVLFFLLLTLLMRYLGFVLNVIQVKTFLSISKQISLRLREKIIRHLEGATLKEYEAVSPSAITSKLVTDVNTIDSFIGTTVSKFIISILTILFTGIVLLIIDWQLALFILITNPIVVFFTSKLARNVGKLKRHENKATEVFQSTLGETLELFHQIKAANKELYFFGRARDKAQELRDTSIAFGYRSDRAIRLSFLIFLSGYELFRAVSILSVAYGDLSIGLMLAIFGYLWIMMTPTQDIINFQYALSNAKAACSRINSIYEMEQERVISNPKDPFESDNRAEIILENIDFSYISGKSILKNINIKIADSQKIAIVGASGSGKTTLANLIVGFYQPDGGSIRYNGIDSNEISLSTIRANSHIILQNPKLFNDTLLFNLTLGDEFDSDTIQRVIEISQLSSVISLLEDGLDTIVGKDGIKLSGGQRQRIAIARMILLDPKIVIFDESTSALDIHTETKLFSALHDYLSDKTVITIAHRLSTIQSAEYIYVIEDGEIDESGTPTQLLAQDKSYFNNMI